MEAKEAVNDSSKYVCQARKLIADYLDLTSVYEDEHQVLLLAVNDLLDKAIEVLAKSL